VDNKILVSAAELNGLIGNGRCVVVDCRFDFEEADAGRADWLAGHIPGAVYADLDKDLSAPIEPHTGRHPLPDPARFAAWLASIGWSPDKLLVAYDEGPLAVAARLWWLMRYFGQPSALLDGGLPSWRVSGRPLESGDPAPVAAVPIDLQPDKGTTVDSGFVFRHLQGDAMMLLDARSSQRFRGEMETLDTRAGHIPGSLNRHYAANLELGRRFKDPASLREEFQGLLGERDPRVMVHTCGSGVTACHNLFAMELAGLGGSRLYPGSWSEWIRDPARPIETDV
jgi:thiosulfate/3-mercaptopyruvate sulfurtransferase